jgi:hypothetical protein
VIIITFLFTARKDIEKVLKRQLLQIEKASSKTFFG